MEVIDGLKDLVGMLGDFGNALTSFLKIIIDLIVNFGETIGNSLNFIAASISAIMIYSVKIFTNLPNFFSYGITCVIGVIIFLFILRIFQLIKFW